MGHLEGETQRMVTTPWFDHEIPMSEAAEIGTRKVIAEHSTIGIVITTDGTITEIPREDYLEAEDRVITELKELGKPFWSSSTPLSQLGAGPGHPSGHQPAVRGGLPGTQLPGAERGGHQHRPEGCALRVPGEGAGPVPAPLGGRLAQDHPIKSALYTAIREGASDLYRIRDVEQTVRSIKECEEVSDAG